ncbi:major facilitator superfamily transporter [Drepanopeziza brunnea f. sp. 'multigermtubi' MB_m1]|uniref:Major facilitator superfamily transporter n=1 Tax=Marssonina brunnea f. sp. multigermtubi (strain MB_m1) TaxID=1072389 RepID=K1XMR3_MARBU|nr:major facilitator superfamily transporter [Drepanopeziza brunnea f. sp. 'multigermtubi' MB_m1]EKD21823.1 major facilitator superfamily transporter [Drepanopeziza brunnea f. sp. 'multigermtubi' MB_m1]
MRKANNKQFRLTADDASGLVMLAGLKGSLSLSGRDAENVNVKSTASISEAPTPDTDDEFHALSQKEVTARQVAPLVLLLTSAAFINTLSIQSVVIILPGITDDLDIPETRQQWIVSAYSLTAGSFLLLSGKLGDVYGKRWLFIIGCFWFTIFTLAVAFSPVEICMYIMRALQGLGAAITVPTAIGIIGYTVPPGRIKNYSFAFYSAGAPTGQVFGNLLGGIISQYADWKVVFFVIAGMGFAIAVSAIFVIQKEPSRGQSTADARAASVDWIGAFFFTAGALLLLISLSEGASSGWDTPYVVVLLILALLLIAIFVYWQHYLESRAREPLMRTSTFRNVRFSVAMVIALIFSAGFTNFVVYSTYFYQDYQGHSPIQTTLRYIPLGIFGILGTVAAGYLMDRIRGNYILIVGLTLGTISNILFAVPIPPSTSYWAYAFLAMCFAGIGADTVYPCLGLFITQSLPRKDQSVAGAMFQTFAGLGRAMFLPITATIQDFVQRKLRNQGKGELPALLEGIRAVEWFCAAAMGFCLLLTICGLGNMGKIGLLKKLGTVQSDTKEKDEEVI